MYIGSKSNRATLQTIRLDCQSQVGASAIAFVRHLICSICFFFVSFASHFFSTRNQRKSQLVHITCINSKRRLPSSYHKSCLNSLGGIWMAQELWLTEKQLTQHQLGTSFVVRSGMEEAVSSGVMRGRPFGGVSIAWSPDLNHVITPLPNYKHRRVQWLQLNYIQPSKALFSYPFICPSWIQTIAHHAWLRLLTP